MESPLGLRAKKKRETRRRLGDVAARLFAERGYDSVSVSDVARAAGVAEQTVYNYFPTKPDLVLDRADEILERTRRLVAERDPAATPADALTVLVHDDLDRFIADERGLARGEFPALSRQSELLRRHALAFHADQVSAIAGTIAVTDPSLPRLVARTHAAALVAIVQEVTERIGDAVIAGADRVAVADELGRDAGVALADAAQGFRAAQDRAMSRRVR